jgi:DNA-binding transcriptional MerR regulator
MRYRIGEFARLAGTTIKTLRLYDQARLLVPAHVDVRTRYRLYAPEQLRDITAIRALRELGASLGDIRAVLARKDDFDRRRLLVQLRDRAVERVREARRSLRWLEAELESGPQRPESVSIVVKRRPQIRVASIRARLGTYAEIGPVEQELVAAVSPRFIGPARGVLWHRCEASGAIDGEPFIEVAARAPRPAGVELKQLPHATVASAFCESDDAAAVRTYDAIDRWLHAHDYRLAGPKRELYVGQILEIQFPVRPA